MNKLNNKKVRIINQIVRNFKKNRLRLSILKKVIFNITKRYVVRLRGTYFSDFEVEKAHGGSLLEIKKKQIHSFIFEETHIIKNLLVDLPEELISDLINKANLVLSDYPIIFDRVYINSVKNEEGEYLWDEDFLNKKKYPRVIFYDINLRENEGEVKVPWEFARLQMLITLAQAYLITKNKTYIEKVIQIIKSFNRCNPCGFGVNWMNSMEVGIRISNMLSAYTLIIDDIDDSDEIHEIINKMAIEHGLFIYKNLEKTGKHFSNNHYIANLLGLLSIISAYPKIEFSKKITSFVLSEFECEIEKQILSDGLSFEGTISYTRLIGECFYYSLIIMNKSKLTVPKNYREKLLKISEALKWLETNSGDVPQIGDNDSGRALILSYRNALDYSYLAELIQFETNNIFLRSKSTVLERIFLYGDILVNDINNTVTKEVYEFTESNLIVYKNKDLYFLFTASDPLKRGVPGHMHNDKLSFILQYRGKDFFVDPGTGSYTANSKVRNMLRSTSSHNTVKINDEEQNRFTTSVFGYLYDGGASFSHSFEGGELKISGETDCYLRRIGVIHYRNIVINKNSISILDRYKNINHLAYGTSSNFTLHPKVVVRRINDNTIALKHDEIEIIFKSENEVLVDTNLYSEKYNEWEKTIVLRIKSDTYHSSKVEVELNEYKK